MRIYSAIFALAATSCIALAQSEPGKTPAFEVASIKPHVFVTGQRPACGRSVFGSRVTLPCMSLRSLAMMAYGVKAYQITGGPAWLTEIGDTSYDLVAKAEGEEKPTEPQIAAMLQTLLADRFEFKFHRETREVPVYALFVDKRGPKRTDSAPDATGGSSFSFGGVQGHMTFTKGTMAQFALALITEAGRPVMDRTGLTGTYKFELTWTRDQPQQIPGIPPAPGEAIAAPRDGPSLFTAVQDQLGLRLEAQKGPVDYLFVDHAARPSEN